MSRGYLCRTVSFLFLCFQLSYGLVFAQEQPIVYDESKIPPYTLPDPLMLQNGNMVKDSKMWWKLRRPEILSFFEDQVYGKTPKKKLALQFELESSDPTVFKGKATRKEMVVYFTPDLKGPSMTVLIYLPNDRQKPLPVFLAMNFMGNHTINGDTTITITENWVANNKHFKIENNHADQRSRGVDSASWPVQQILQRGYGLVTFYYGDIAPDNNDCFQKGIFPLFYKPGQTKPEPNEWGAIGAWAWGLSRAMDCIEQDFDIDAKNVILLGHSRLGKAALWAGAQDQRFAIVVSNNSGAGGAALSKRIYGETVKAMNTFFPYWFCDNFKQYNDNEAALSVDQHELLSLIAPRPLYVASAEDDHWSDPQGEFLSALLANPVYKLLHTEGFPAVTIPGANQPVLGTIGYHIRTGKHAITEYDWEQYMDFADYHFKK
jgi:hypothetical protein